MKTYKHLFPETVSFEKLIEVARKAQKDKHYKHSTAGFNPNLENELFRLQRQLTVKTYCHGSYTDFVIHDTKQRRIRQMAAEYESGKISLDRVCQRVQSWNGHASHADTWKNKGPHSRQRGL